MSRPPAEAPPRPPKDLTANRLRKVSDGRAPLRFGPLERRLRRAAECRTSRRALNLRRPFGLLCLYVTKSVVGLTPALVALDSGAAVITITVCGRTPLEWAPVVLRWRLRSGRDYRSSAPGAGMRAGADETYGRSLPPELGDLDLLSVPYGAEEVGVIPDRRAGTYTATIAVRAGAFALRDPEEQGRALEAWGAVLASCSREGSPLRRLQWIERTLPGQGDELASYLQEKRDRSVPLESSVVSSYIELLEAAAVTQEHDVLLALQIDARRAGRDLKRFGGGEEGRLRAAPARGRGTGSAPRQRRDNRFRPAAPSPVRGGDPRLLLTRLGRGRASATRLAREWTRR
jgi:hypothetical protein